MELLTKTFLTASLVFGNTIVASDFNDDFFEKLPEKHYSNNSSLGESKPFNQSSAKQKFINHSPTIYHWIDDFPQENTIQLEDGSEWSFDISEAYIVEGWKTNAPIVISPKVSLLWGSKYEFLLTNHDTGESVVTKLIDGPIAFGNYTHWIAVSDWNNGHLHFVNAQGDRTVWEVSPSDISQIKEWSTNQSVIIGENSSWLWALSDYNHIIINVELNYFIRAKPVSYTPSFHTSHD